MFVNFWYPVATSDELKDTPKKIRILGQYVVAFRDAEGIPHCLSDICCHRGASLGTGSIKDGCLRCPYHGWEFGGDGVCQRIPALGSEGKVPKRARVDAYPTTEKYGLVFAFLGDLPESDRPPILEIEEYDEPGWRATLQQFEWDIDYRRSIENSIDPAHNEFVHDTHGFSGELDSYQVHPLNMQETDWGTGFYHKVYAPPLAEKRMREASERTEPTFIDAGTGHHGISSVWTHIHPTPEMFLHQYLFEAPVELDKTRLFLVTLRNFLPAPEHDERIMERNAYVANQDRDVLMNVRPVVTPNTNVNEIFITTDHPIGRYRERMKEWEERGWRIDMKALKATEQETAYAIPSPARRTHKGWTIKPIPLVNGGG